MLPVGLPIQKQFLPNTGRHKDFQSPSTYTPLTVFLFLYKDSESLLLFLMIVQWMSWYYAAEKSLKLKRENRDK